MPGAIQTISNILNLDAKTISRQEIFDRLFAQAKQRTVIDPESIIRAQNNPHLNQALHNAQAYQQRILTKQVDAGAVALDELAGRLGQRTNFASTLTYPTTHYVLEPGVYYKQQHKLDPKVVRPTVNNPGVIQEFIGFKQIPMMDWDVAGPYHAERNATIRHLGDVEDRIQNYLTQNPETTLRLYQTPGGYRAYDMTSTATPRQYNSAFDLLDVDPDYRMISQQTPAVLKYEGPIAVNDTERFNVRINPKVGRVDWVAQPIAQIQGQQAITNVNSRRLIETYHDNVIQQNFLKGEAQQAGINKVKENLPTASQFLQDHITNYLGL